MWRGVLPLIGTFGRAELEFAAALMVLACRDNGDTWQAVKPREVGNAMQLAGEKGKEMHHLKGNPFLPRPDIHGLIEKGFAEFDGNPEDGCPIRFTAKGLEVLAKCVFNAEASNG